MIAQDQDDDSLMEQFRIETQIEIERQKRQEAQRALIESRNMVQNGTVTYLTSWLTLLLWI